MYYLKSIGVQKQNQENFMMYHDEIFSDSKILGLTQRVYMNEQTKNLNHK